MPLQFVSFAGTVYWENTFEEPNALINATFLFGINPLPPPPQPSQHLPPLSLSLSFLFRRCTVHCTVYSRLKKLDFVSYNKILPLHGWELKKVIEGWSTFLKGHISWTIGQSALAQYSGLPSLTYLIYVMTISLRFKHTFLCRRLQRLHEETNKKWNMELNSSVIYKDTTFSSQSGSKTKPCTAASYNLHAL